MTTERRIDAIVDGWLKRTTVSPYAAERTVADVMARLPGIPQGARPTPEVASGARPSTMRAPARGVYTPPLAWRSRTMSSAIKVFLASALLALTGGYLIMGAVTQRPSRDPVPPPVPSASASPATEPSATPSATVAPTMTPPQIDASTNAVALPAEIPEGVRSGKLKTPLGAARWVHLSGDEDTLPPMLSPVAAPSGYVTIDWGERVTGSCDGPETCRRPAIWRSPDLITWSREPLPVVADGAELIRSGGDYWLVTYGPTTLWRSSDTSAWDPIELSQLRPSGPPGLDWVARLGVPATSQGVVGVAIDYVPVDAASYLGLTLPDGVDHVGLRAADSGRYQALGGNEELLATVRFEEIDGGLRVIDDADGSVLQVLEGASRESIERWAMSGTPFEPQIGLLEGERLVSVDLPGAASASERISRLFGNDTGFVAYRPVGGEAVGVWRSSDGRTWTDAGVLGDDEGEPPGDSLIFAGPGLVLASGPKGQWRSSDGLRWREVSERGFSVELAGVRLRVTLDSLSFAREGQKATRVDLTKLRLKRELDGANSKGFGVLGPNTVAYQLSNESGDGERQIWIITFDELPS
jgi:hypothetical protein